MGGMNSWGAKRWRVVARELGWAVACLAAVVLIGWVFDVPTLKSVFARFVSMKPNTAAGLLLLGVSLVLLSGERVSNTAHSLSALAAAIAASIGVLTLSEYLFEWDLGIDNLRMPDQPFSVDTSHPGRMSPATALCFAQLGAALLSVSLRTVVRAWQPIVAGLSATVIGIGALALLGYFVEAAFAYRLWNYTGTAVHTAVALMLLAGGLMALVHAERGLTWMLDRTSTSVFIGAIVLMMLAGGTAFSVAMQLRETDRLVSGTLEALKSIQEVATDVADIESTQRGYIITGDQTVFERFRTAKERVPIHLAFLRTVTSDNRNQQQRLDQLEPLIAQRIDLAGQTIDARNQRGFEAAQQLVATGTGTALSDNIRTSIGQMDEEERALLDGRRRESETASVKTFLLLPLGLFLSLATLSLGVFFLNRGVGERLRAEQLASGSEARMAGIVTSALDAIISIDSDQRIVLFNAAAEKIFRCPVDAAMGQSIEKFIPEKFRDSHRGHVKRFGRTAVTSRSVRSLETLKGLSADGREFPIEASISQINVAGQRFFTVILRDVSERRQLEDQLRQSQKMEAIGQLAGGVAHDFNNLLTVILGYCDLALNQPGIAASFRQDLDEIRGAGERATVLVGQLLAFSRKQVLQPRVLDLNEVITDTHKMLRRVIGEDIELVSITRPGLGHALADAGQIEQIILNLAVNSRDAMPNGGKLTIETANVELDAEYAKTHAEVIPGPYVLLAVSDTGQGIDAETQSHIFEPFFTTKGIGRGTGLGLSTVYGIVKQSGGHIWLYSEPGKGATFKVYFPRVDAPVETSKQAPARVESLRGSETLLVAEDEDAVRELTRSILEKYGYNVLVAVSGPEALVVARQTANIALLITDVVMPQMSGKEVASVLAKEAPQMRILYLSGYTENAIVHHGVLDEGVAFLPKPFTPEGLARKVREVLDSR